MSKAYAPHLAIIRESISAIDRYRPPDEAAFLADPLVQDAVLMRLQVIGENLVQMRRLDADVFEQQAADCWNKVTGLRKVIFDG